MAVQQGEGIRRPRIRVFCSERLAQVVNAVIPDYAGRADIRVIDRLFADAAEEARRLADADEADAFVCAGANGEYLRSHLTAPVVMIRVSGFDVLEALGRARRMAERVALVSHKSIHGQLARFAESFGIAVEQRVYETVDDARLQVSELARQGYQAVAGASAVTACAEQAGLTGVFLYTRESVSEAVEDAIEITRVARIEEARWERLNSVLRHLNEGVVAVDMEERVQTMNPAMEKLLGTPAQQALGRRLSEISRALSLEETLKSGRAELEDVQAIGARTVVVNRLPILEGGARTGAVATCHDAYFIQRADRSLRTRERSRSLAARYELAQIAGGSAAMAEARSRAAHYAATDATVLITGESGTGKELFAQGIHNASRRRLHGFVAFNCGAFPEPLLESELFGYEEGAFTGSRRGGKAGLFEAAHGGTLFLDEVAEMPVALQTRLLRALQEREILRLGATEPTPVDVRVIAATHRDLRAAVADGLFREDLYYRLNILRLHIAPLRERADDLPAIMEQVLRETMRRHAAQADPIALVAALLPWFRRYAWPGNVREMENILERIVVSHAMRGTAVDITEAGLRGIAPELFEVGGAAARSASRDLRGLARDSEIAHIRKVLDECGGNHAEACRRLGIGRTTLWRKLKAG